MRRVRSGIVDVVVECDVALVEAVASRHLWLEKIRQNIHELVCERNAFALSWGDRLGAGIVRAGGALH